MTHNSTNEFIDGLLYQNESTSLDFKAEQYHFNGASLHEKSELLKDILAFANSSRSEDAIIAIGIHEEVGKKHTVIGTEEHFNDAQLQQFVNSKINKNINISYEVFIHQGKKVGIIRIGKQERPIFLKLDFGKLKKNTVYFRLGSSTSEATPDDICQMKIDDLKITQPAIILDLQFANCQHKKLGNSITIESISHDKPLNKLLDAKDCKSIYSHPTGKIYTLDSNYWNKLEEYTRLTSLLKPIIFVISNQSNILAQNIHLEFSSNFIDKSPVEIFESLPLLPSENKYDNLVSSVSPFKEKSIIINKYDEHCEVNIKIGDIKPKSTTWVEQFYIGAKENTNLKIKAKAYGSNLAEPQTFILNIDFVVVKVSTLTISELRTMHNINNTISPY